MTRTAQYWVILGLIMGIGCTTTRTGVPIYIIAVQHDNISTPGLEYTWQHGDSWRFLSWAVLDDESAAEALALRSGFTADSLPRPGDSVLLPFTPSLEEPLESRLRAARLVREATDSMRAGSTHASLELLSRASREDTTWSVPLYDTAILYIRAGDLSRARSLLREHRSRYRMAMLLAFLCWETGASHDAIDLLEYAMMDEDPPGELLAAAALAYSVSGNSYNACQLWRRVLSDPDVESGLRLMAVRYALVEEMRRMEATDPTGH